MDGQQLYTVVAIRETTAADARGMAVRTKAIQFKVGDNGPFTYVVPPGQFTPGLVADALAKEATLIQQIAGGAA